MLQKAIHHAKPRKQKKIVHCKRWIMPIKIIRAPKAATSQKLHVAQDNQENHNTTKAL